MPYHAQYVHVCRGSVYDRLVCFQETYNNSCRQTKREADRVPTVTCAKVDVSFTVPPGNTITQDAIVATAEQRVARAFPEYPDRTSAILAMRALGYTKEAKAYASLVGDSVHDANRTEGQWNNPDN